MRKGILILLIVFFYNEIFPQWIFQNSNTNATLNSVFFLNEQLGWIVCNDGNILRTTNSGVDWISHSVDPESDIKSIYFLTAQSGYAAGSNNLYKSIDGGFTWFILNSFNNYSISKIYFINNDIAFLSSGNKILKTTNAGDSWAEIVVEDNVTPFAITDITFRDLNVGWLSISEGTTVGGSIYKSTDGGESWNRIYQSTDRKLNITSFANSDILYSIGVVVLHGAYRSLHKSVDDGYNWIQINPTIGPMEMFFYPLKKAG